MDEEDIQGNIATYTAMLAAQESYDEAERWLWRMEDEYGITPTTRTYNTCLHALLNNNSDMDDATTADRALALLSRMEKCYYLNEERNVNIQPDLVTYTTIANILRKHGSSGGVDTVRLADWLLLRVRGMGYELDGIFSAAIEHLRLSKE